MSKSAIKTGVVTEFRGDYAFLSNYDKHAPFMWRNKEFTSGEQAFAFAKTFYATSKSEETRFSKSILSAPSPGDAKKFGRHVKIDVNMWDMQKISIMREIQSAKYAQVPDYSAKLLNTGAMLLVEGNTWGDEFWGRCNGRGMNMLGSILMEERGRWLHLGGTCGALDGTHQA